MIAMPVAMPRRSGNHLIRVETGEMYPRPSPIPPIRPMPSQTSQSWWTYTPSAPTRKPPPQQRAATSPALRGPARSSQPPNRAADSPSITMPMEKTMTRSLTRQSQVVVNRAVMMPMSPQAAGAACPTERALVRGSQNTDRP